MNWTDFYEKLDNWSTATAVKNISQLRNIGPVDEVLDAIVQIAYDDEAGADKLLRKALQFDLKFSGADIASLCLCCTDEGLMNAAIFSADSFTAEDLEELVGIVDDDIIIGLAKKQQLSIPGELRDDFEEPEEKTDFGSYEIRQAIRSVDNALGYLLQLQQLVKTSRKSNLIDYFAKGTFSALVKYSSMTETERYMVLTQDALAELECDLGAVLHAENLSLPTTRLMSLWDVVSDCGFFDYMTAKRLDEVKRRVDVVIQNLKELRAELEKIQ